MEVLLQAFVLGAVAGFIPGAVMTLLFVSVMQGGLPAGMRAFFWSMIFEIVIAGGLLVIATQLPLKHDFFTAVGLVGGTVLLYFSWKVLHLRAVNVQNDSVLFTAPKIFILSATNAPLYIFWSTICFPLIWDLSVRWTLPVAAISYFVVFEIAWAITTIISILLFVYSRATLSNERIMHKVFTVLAVIFMGFGIKLIASGILLVASHITTS